MANHAIITSKRFFNEHRLDEVIREVNDRRFNGAFKVTKWNDVYWEVEHPVSGWRNKVSITIDSRRRLHLRLGVGGELNHWIQFVFQEEIAKAFNGRCGNEGVSNVWDPDPTKYPTMRAYFKDVNQHIYSRRRTAKKEVKFLDDFFVKIIKQLPEDLRVFAGVKL